MRDEPVDAAPRIAQDSRNLLREPHEDLAVLAPQRMRQRWRPGTFVRLALDDNVPTSWDRERVRNHCLAPHHDYFHFVRRAKFLATNPASDARQQRFRRGGMMTLVPDLHHDKSIRYSVKMEGRVDGSSAVEGCLVDDTESVDECRTAWPAPCT